MENRSQTGYLDRLRLSRGIPALRREFQRMLKRNRPLAIYYMNEGALRFPTLFLLLPAILSEGLAGRLNDRNRAALDLCARTLNWRPGPLPPAPDRKGPETGAALKWMLETGRSWEGPMPEAGGFDAVLDRAAAVLIVTFHDTSVLPWVAELIFHRNRRGFYIHDLVWSFFQADDPDSVLLLERWAETGEEPDAELACQLLHLEAAGGAEARRQRCRQYRDWLGENRGFLYFTGEQFQMTSQPKPLGLDREAKYLQKEICPRRRTPLSPVTEEERTQLGGFRTCSREEQKLLCEYSARLCREDRDRWEDWRREPMVRQVMAAQGRTEVV